MEYTNGVPASMLAKKLSDSAFPQVCGTSPTQFHKTNELERIS